MSPDPLDLDPLADLLAEIANAEPGWEGWPAIEAVEFCWEAERLRANRDRVLEALGGKLWERHVERSNVQRMDEAWLFPKEPGK